MTDLNSVARKVKTSLEEVQEDGEVTVREFSYTVYRQKNTPPRKPRKAEL